MFIFVLLAFLPPDVQACGSNFTQASGYFESPGYPGYNSSLDCVYVIKGQQGERITLTFQQFDIQNLNGSCTYKFLELRDGDSAEALPIMGYPCNSSWAGLRKRGFHNSMYIRINVVGLQTGIRFRVNYTSAVLLDAFLLISATQTTDTKEILRVDMEMTSIIQIPRLRLLIPVAVDFDPIEGRLYWTDIGLDTISSAYLNGSDQRTLRYLGGDTKALGIAVDPVSRLVFYTDEGNGVIGMMSMSGSSHKTVIQSIGSDRPRAIVLDTMNGVVFWSEWTETPPRIKRANYDGTDRRAILSLGLRSPNALALDVSNDRIYWVDGTTNEVEYSDLNGNMRTTLYTMSPGSTLFALAHYQQHLFVVNWTADSGSAVNKSHVWRLSTDGRPGELLMTGSFRMNDIHVYVEDGWQRGPNGCSDKNGGCSYFCIPLPGNASKCLCPDTPTSCVDEPASKTTSPTPRPSITTVPLDTITVKGPDFFETNSSHEMTLTCGPENRKPVAYLAWSVPCVKQQDRKCEWRPKVPEDDRKMVTCSILYVDGESAFGSFTVNLNYPPLAPPLIHGYKNGDVLHAGDSVTMTCQVRDGKPLVTSVFFSCPGHPDSVTDVRGDSEVQSLLIINPLKAEEDGLRCVCTAEWKRSEWYALSATRTLSVKDVNTTTVPEVRPPVAVIVGAVVGAVAGCGVTIIGVIFAVVVIRRRRETLKRPVQLTPNGTAEAQQGPQSAVNGSNVDWNRLMDVSDVPSMRSSFTYDEILDWQSGERTADQYLRPVVFSDHLNGSTTDRIYARHIQSTDPERHGSTATYLQPVPSAGDQISSI